jgi:hypothetical protein
MPESAYELEPALIDAFVVDELNDAGQHLLAEQVARLLPLHWTLPHELQGQLKRITDHLGSRRALLAWLDRHPGEPRLVARIYALTGLLDSYSDNPAVVTALAEFRDRTPYPPGLEDHLTPSTDIGTLASLSGKIESLMGEGRTEEAARVALATLDMLREIAPRVIEHDSTLHDFGDVVAEVQRELVEAIEEKRQQLPDGT